MAADPRLIPGVYNYCDRWCERCRLTSRCLVFARKREAADCGDIDGWLSRVAQDLSDTVALLQAKAAELGVDLSAAQSPMGHSAAQWATALATQHPLLEHARHYATLADVWLARHTSPAPLGSAAHAVEVIRWYQLQIAAKLFRALRSLVSVTDGSEQDLQADSNGSAKVALIGIEASLGAWLDLLRPAASRHGVAAIVGRLNLLRQEVEEVFPHARAFVRPGFDTGDVPWPDDLPVGVSE
jgi:hypothetical protein